jgi:hypothetical protein
MNLAELGKSSAQYAKQAYMAETKAGKTTWLVASLLGALPGQTESVVSTPADLHILGFDEGFGDGLGEFIVSVCKKDPKLLGVTVHPLAEARRRSGAAEEWDYGFFSAISDAVKKINAATSVAHKAGRVSAVVVSSLTGMNEGLQTGLSGPPSAAKKGGMDKAKWPELERQIIALRNQLHMDQHHVFWECHILKGEKQEGNTSVQTEEVDAGSGKGGKHFGANVEFIFRLRREMAKYEGTAVDKCFVDTKPSMGSFATGRKATLLADRETNLVEILKKLGKATHGKAL